MIPLAAEGEQKPGQGHAGWPPAHTAFAGQELQRLAGLLAASYNKRRASRGSEAEHEQEALGAQGLHAEVAVIPQRDGLGDGRIALAARQPQIPHAALALVVEESARLPQLRAR